MRIGNFFVENEFEYIEGEQARMGVKQLFDEDLDESIAQCFDKLDISDESRLSVKYIRQGLLVNGKTHVNKSKKAQNKVLLEFIYNMRSSKTFGKVDFSAFIRQQLQKQLEVDV